MIGAVDKQYLFELLEGIINQNGEALLEKAQEMSARAIGFDSALAELAMLLQRLALIQTIPSALANDDPERETLLRLSQALSGRADSALLSMCYSWQTGFAAGSRRVCRFCYDAFAHACICAVGRFGLRYAKSD